MSTGWSERRRQSKRDKELARQTRAARSGARAAWLTLLATVGAIIVAVVGIVANRASHPGPQTNSVTAVPGTGLREPLGANTTVSYTDGPAFALAGPLSGGSDYVALIGGTIGNYGDAGWGPYLSRNGGAPVELLHADITLTNQGTTPIRVIDAAVKMSNPPEGNLSGSNIPIPHAGGISPFKFTVNMDSPEPRLVGDGAQQSFPDFNIDLAPAEQSTLAVDFKAELHTYTWTIIATYLDGTQRHTLEIDDPQGKPFKLTGPATTYETTFASDFPTDTGYHPVVQH